MTRERARVEDPGLTIADLVDIEVRLLQRIALDGPYTSPVTLAADEWRGRGDWLVGNVETVMWVLYGLCDQGLLIIRESTERKPVWGIGMNYVRATPAAYDLLDIPLHPHQREVGARAKHGDVPTVMGDMTEFRNQPETTAGGPIEKLSREEHLAVYPHHLPIHPREDGTVTAVEAREYIRVTSEMQADVLAARNRLGNTASYAEIAEAVDLPPRTVRYILTEVPALRRMLVSDAKAGKSLKARIVEVLQVLGEVKTVAEMRRILGMADTDHDIVHVLHSLHTQGKVDFREDRDGKAPINIHLTKGYRPTDAKVEPFVEERVHESVEVTDSEAEPEAESLTIADVFPNVIDMTQTPPPGDEYPLLDGIIEREYKRQMWDETQTAYLKAAEALKGVDDATAAELLEKGAQHDIPYPSPLEAEYFRYALKNAPERPVDVEVTKS